MYTEHSYSIKFKLWNYNLAFAFILNYDYIRYVRHIRSVFIFICSSWDSIEDLLSIQATVYSSKTTSNKLWAVKAEIWAHTEFVLSMKIAKLSCSFKGEREEESTVRRVRWNFQWKSKGIGDIRKNCCCNQRSCRYIFQWNSFE